MSPKVIIRQSGILVLIDLTGKLFVFLEPPHPDTWSILKPILSHDDYEIEHPYVYEVEGMGFKVKKVVTRGWPACIFCSAKNESKWPVWPEIQSRFLITSPNMSSRKYLEGNVLTAHHGSSKIGTAVINHIGQRNRACQEMCSILNPENKGL